MPAGAESVTAGVQVQVADWLRRRIISGELESGAGLSEVALAREFGASRTPVREALKQLQTEGLVEVRPRVGTFVSAPSRLEIIELFQMKEILEGAAARLFAERAEAGLLETIRANVERSDAAVAANDAVAYTALVEEFHDTIIHGAGNSKLAAHYRMLMNQLAYSRLVSTSLSYPGRLYNSCAEHRRVLKMVLSKDGTTAERIMREHVRASRDALLGAMVFPGEEGGQ